MGKCANNVNTRNWLMIQYLCIIIISIIIISIIIISIIIIIITECHFNH